MSRFQCLTSTTKNGQIWLYCHFNKIIKDMQLVFSKDISRTKHFFFKSKNSLITRQRLFYSKNSFVAEVTFNANHNLMILKTP